MRFNKELFLWEELKWEEWTRKKIISNIILFSQLLLFAACSSDKKIDQYERVLPIVEQSTPKVHWVSNKKTTENLDSEFDHKKVIALNTFILNKKTKTHSITKKQCEVFFDYADPELLEQYTTYLHDIWVPLSYEHLNNFFEKKWYIIDRHWIDDIYFKPIDDKIVFSTDIDVIHKLFEWYTLDTSVPVYIVSMNRPGIQIDWRALVSKAVYNKAQTSNDKLLNKIAYNELTHSLLYKHIEILQSKTNQTLHIDWETMTVNQAKEFLSNVVEVWFEYESYKNTQRASLDAMWYITLCLEHNINFLEEEFVPDGIIDSNSNLTYASHFTVMKFGYQTLFQYMTEQEKILIKTDSNIEPIFEAIAHKYHKEIYAAYLQKWIKIMKELKKIKNREK